MEVNVKLTATGVNTGPNFNLYSDVDNYTIPFGQNITKLNLTQQGGLLFANVPNGTTKIKVENTEGDCSHLIINVVLGNTN